MPGNGGKKGQGIAVTPRSQRFGDCECRSYIKVRLEPANTASSKELMRMAENRAQVIPAGKKGNLNLLPPVIQRASYFWEVDQELQDATLTLPSHQGPFRVLTCSCKMIITKLIGFQKMQFELNIVPLLLLCIYIKPFSTGIKVI